jgi:hypothetical protein
VQINELADELNVGVTHIKRFLRGHPCAQGRTFAGAEESLDREQEREVRAAHAAGILWRNRGATNDVATTETEPDLGREASDLDGLTPVVVSRWPLPARGEEAYPVFAHSDVLDWLNDPTTPASERKVFTRRVQEFMAHGHATRMKGVRGKNAGWLRTPLGGNGGNQFYLWLMHHGESIRGGDEAARALFAETPSKARFLRAVRHHDATKDLLDAGKPADYMRLPANDVLEGRADGLAEPLVEAQLGVVEDSSRIRVLVGRPGAGKTAALQAAASTLTGRALYVTWSAELAARAKAWFAAFGPRDLDITVWTFRELLGHIDASQSLAAELPIAVAVDELRVLAERILPQGPWRHRSELRAEELHAELHAHFIGAALPVPFAGREASDQPRLSDTDYRSLRATAIGLGATSGPPLVVRRMKPDDVRRIFSAPVAAFERAQGLQTGRIVLDARFAFDWVLVDEVQDLTLVELWLLVDVTARSGAARGVKPGMVVAGDEAQTVRPTAFEFGRLSLMLETRLHARAERSSRELVQNLRSPWAIARVVERVGESLYGLLPRRERPRGSRGDGPADVTVAKVAHVEIDGAEDTRRVLETFKELAGDAALVYPAARAPDDLSHAARLVGVTLWTSDAIKGLEFRTVGVLDVPREVRRIRDLATSTREEGLAVELARTSIDRLLVALSRSNENLVLLGTGWADMPDFEQLLDDNADVAASTDGNLGRVALADLPGLLEIDAADATERIETQLSNSRRLQDLGSYEDAAREADNARGLLGPVGRPGSAGRDLRIRTHRRFAAACVAFALKGGPTERLRVASRAYRSAEAPRMAELVTALAGSLSGSLEELDTWKRIRELVNGLSELADQEPSVVGLVFESLRTRIASLDDLRFPRTSAARRAYLEALAELAREAPSDREGFREVHQRRLVNICQDLHTRKDRASREEYAALRSGIMDSVRLATLDAEHAEALGDLSTAARRFEEAGLPESALRCARRQADFEHAARLASATQSPDAATLHWALELQTLLASRPPSGTFTEEERAFLQVRIGDALRAQDS